MGFHVTLTVPSAALDPATRGIPMCKACLPHEDESSGSPLTEISPDTDTKSVAPGWGPKIFPTQKRSSPASHEEAG